jgi:uncharacterized protein DUF6200
MLVGPSIRNMRQPLEDTSMAQQGSATAEHRQPAKTEAKEKSSLVVVELKNRRTPEQVRRLRKGRGRLMSDIEDVVADLTTAGTINADAQPVVIVVRETVPLPFPLPWPLNAADLRVDDQDDDNDEDDEDDDD